MNMKIYNNLHRKKEEFTPLEGNKVSLYSCGPTTYDFVHVGNARAFIVGDLMYRILESLGYEVSFVRNFTDVDDKIIQRAKEIGVDPLDHSDKFMKECINDMDALGLKRPTYTPKVSETIPEIIAIVERLIEKGYGYVIDGEVFFNVPKFKDYGKLSKKDLESLEYGKRVEVDVRKRHPSDFVLWKPVKDGEPFWDSPWGKGRPGWHIECSAMAKKFLGESIDIHHGGVDLCFPHHENEIAQSEAAWDKEFVRYWCHNEFLNFGSEKMSKSLGNVITIRNFVEQFGGEILRHLLSSVHYRSKMEWSDEVIEKAFSEVERIHTFLKYFEDAKENNISESSEFSDIGAITEVTGKMKQELQNDFNVPGAISHFFTMIRLLNRELLDQNGNYSSKKKMTSEIALAIENVIEFTRKSTGLIHDISVLDTLNNARKNLQSGGSGDEGEIENLIKDRAEARASKDWGRADQIRNKLVELGVVLKDNPDGTVSWSYK